MLLWFEQVTELSLQAAVLRTGHQVGQDWGGGSIGRALRAARRSREKAEEAKRARDRDERSNPADGSHTVAAAGWQRWDACGGCLRGSASSPRSSRCSVALPLARMKHLRHGHAAHRFTRSFCERTLLL